MTPVTHLEVDSRRPCKSIVIACCAQQWCTVVPIVDSRVLARTYEHYQPPLCEPPDTPNAVVFLWAPSLRSQALRFR